LTRVLTLRELNRTLLARQMLLERRRVGVVRAVGRLVALQAQYAPSPYVSLWSRMDGFRKEQLTRALVDGRVVKAGVLRGTLHVVTRELYPLIQSAYIETQRARVERLGTDPAEVAAAWPDDSVDDAFALAGSILGTDDRWTIAFTLRALPWQRTVPVGQWPHHSPSPTVLWRGPLAPPHEGARRVVRDYVAAYGPATRDDVEQFTNYKVREITAALDGLRTFHDEQGRLLFDLPRGRLAAADVPAPVRFLPPFDSMLLAHRDRSRILPDAHRPAVINAKNLMMQPTFTVDGFVAGLWKIERSRGRWRLRLDPFEPLARAVRAEVEREGERLVAFYES